MAKTELEQAGLETEGMTTSTAKLREEIMALSGVDIMIDDNTFKSTYQIMDELAQKWSDLTDIQQASITELIAGKRQGNIVSSLMENFDIVREALNTSLNSEGSAARENEKYLDSIQGRVANLQSAFQELSSVTLDSGFVKTVVSGFTEVLDILTKIIDLIGIIPTLLTGAGIAAFVKNFARLLFLFLKLGEINPRNQRNGVDNKGCWLLWFFTNPPHRGVLAVRNPLCWEGQVL